MTTIAFDPRLGAEGWRNRARELRAAVAEWIKSHPPEGNAAVADCGALLMLAAGAAVASGGTEEDFLFVARHMYRQTLESRDAPAPPEGSAPGEGYTH